MGSMLPYIAAPWILWQSIDVFYCGCICQFQRNSLIICCCFFSVYITIDIPVVFCWISYLCNNRQSDKHDILIFKIMKPILFKSKPKTMGSIYAIPIAYRRILFSRPCSRRIIDAGRRWCARLFAQAGLQLIWCKLIDHIYMNYMRLFILIGL